MSKYSVYKLTDLAKPASEVEFQSNIFDQEFNKPLVHQVIKTYQANGATGTKSTLTRSETRGGGAKPRRQKGTGRARVGTTRSPLHRSGGMIFAFDPVQTTKKVNKKMYKGALLSILSEQIRRGALKIVENFELNSHKTAEFSKLMKGNEVEKAYMIVNEPGDDLMKATQNLYHYQLASNNQLDMFRLYHANCILIDLESMKRLEECYGS